jgi:phage tail sheath protein FI
MPDIAFHHGTRVFESQETPVLYRTTQSAVVALVVTAPAADAAVFPLNTPVLLKGGADLAKARALGATGTGKMALTGVLDQVGTYTYITRVAEGADAAATLSNLVGDAAAMTGIHALKKCEALYGRHLKPRLVAVPGYTSARPGGNANPIVAALPAVLEKLRAVAFVDGPDTTDEAAVLYRQDVNSDRIYICDPKVLVWDTALDVHVPQPSSARFAGVAARTDRTNGFWWSPSNKPINGIGGLARPISYGDQSNYLNEAHVNTVLNLGEGFVTWGNRVATGIDLNKFLSVRRTMDFINEAVETANLEFVDKPFSKANLKFLIESGNAFMRVLKAEGAILGGRLWLDPERNTDEEMAQGRVTFGVEFEPPAPMEDIRFVAHRQIRYYATLRKEVLEEVAGGALALAA